MSTIAVVNLSKQVPDREFQLMVAACNVQLAAQVGPAHQAVVPSVVAYEHVRDIPDDAWPLRLVDKAEEGAGYGDHTEDQATPPYGRVIVATCLSNGGTLIDGVWSVSATLSHECIEMALDPHVNLWSDDGAGKLWIYEGCDWVENDEGNTITVTDSLGKDAHVGVSNFLFPQAFDPNTKRGTPLDYLGSLSTPFSMTDGGYGVYLHADDKDEKTVNARRVSLAVHTVWGAQYPTWKKQSKNALHARVARKMSKRFGRAMTVHHQEF
jgi:hypothetical protein